MLKRVDCYIKDLFYWLELTLFLNHLMSSNGIDLFTIEIQIKLHVALFQHHTFKSQLNNTDIKKYPHCEFIKLPCYFDWLLKIQHIMHLDRICGTLFGVRLHLSMSSFSFNQSIHRTRKNKNIRVTFLDASNKESISRKMYYFVLQVQLINLL